MEWESLVSEEPTGLNEIEQFRNFIDKSIKRCRVIGINSLSDILEMDPRQIDVAVEAFNQRREIMWNDFYGVSQRNSSDLSFAVWGQEMPTREKIRFTPKTKREEMWEVYQTLVNMGSTGERVKKNGRDER